MNTKDISNLLLKVGGMIIIILTVSSIPSYVSVYTQYQARNISLFASIVIIPNILPLLLGLFLFSKPGKITNKIIQNNATDAYDSSGISLMQIEQICLSTLGFYLLMLSASDIVFHVASFIKAIADIPANSSPPSNSLIFTPAFIATIAELILSMWLIFKAKGIITFVNQIRATMTNEKNA